MLAVYLLLEWAEFSIGLYGQVPSESEPYRQILTGPYWYVFWFVHILAGAAIPIALLAWRPRSASLVGVAAALIAVTFIAVRLNIVIPGLVMPELGGLDTAYVDNRLTFHYVPTLMEWLVLLFIATAGIGALFAGTKLLPLTRGHESEGSR